MKVFELTQDNLDEAAALAKKVLEKGGLVVLPSDTAYGLAANACSKKAVQKVYDFKGRQFAKGLSVFLNNLSQLGHYTIYNKEQEAIIETLLPGSFTVILRSKHRIAPAIEPADGTLGVRIIEHELVQRLTKDFPFPITATSANVSGKGPHFSTSSFLKTLSAKKKAMIDLVVDAGTLPRRPTSTLVRLVGDEIEVLREGFLSLKLLDSCLTKDETATLKAAQRIYKTFLARHLRTKAVVVIMKGDLGTGKTVFAKGIGALFGLELRSPTFVLMDEYPAERSPLKTLYHLDLFRIESEAEILELKLAQFLKKGNLLLIEWGEKLSVFEKLKTKKTAFFLLQIEERGKNKRKLSFYQL